MPYVYDMNKGQDSLKALNRTSYFDLFSANSGASIIIIVLTKSKTSKTKLGTSTKSAEISCQFILADSRHLDSPFVLHPVLFYILHCFTSCIVLHSVLSAVSVPFCDLQRQIGQ